MSSTDLVGEHEQHARRAGEAGEVADVGQAGDQEGVRSGVEAGQRVRRSRPRRALTSIGIGTRCSYSTGGEPVAVGGRAASGGSAAARSGVGRLEQAGHRLRRPAGSRAPPKPAMTPVATGAITEVARQGSRPARVGEVQLDDGPVEGGQGVVQRPGVVGEGAGVDDDGGRPAPGRWMASTRSPSWLDCWCSTVRPCRAGLVGGRRDVIVQGGGPVDLGLPVAEQVEVRARQQQHERARPVTRASSRQGGPNVAGPARPATTARPAGPVEHEGQPRRSPSCPGP